MSNWHRLYPLAVAALLIVTFSNCGKLETPKAFTHWTGVNINRELSDTELKEFSPEVQDLYLRFHDPTIIGRHASDFNLALKQAREVRASSKKIGYGFWYPPSAEKSSEGDIYFGLVVDQDTGKIVGVFSHLLVK